MGLFSDAKDRMIEGMAMAYLNSNLLSPYGRATSLRIDSGNKRVTITMELKGESTPVQIELADYEISNEGDKYFASVKQIQTSREWLTTLGNEQLRGRRFELPAQAGQMLLRTL